MDGQTDRRTDRRTDGRTDGQTDRRKIGRTDGRMNKLTATVTQQAGSVAPQHSAHGQTQRALECACAGVAQTRGRTGEGKGAGTGAGVGERVAGWRTCGGSRCFAQCGRSSNAEGWPSGGRLQSVCNAQPSVQDKECRLRPPSGDTSRAAPPSLDLQAGRGTRRAHALPQPPVASAASTHSMCAGNPHRPCARRSLPARRQSPWLIERRTAPRC